MCLHLRARSSCCRWLGRAILQLGREAAFGSHGTRPIFTSCRQIRAMHERAARRNFAQRPMIGLWLVLAFLSLLFVYPLCRVLLLSLTGAAGHFSLATFEDVLKSATTWRVLLQTVKISVTVSVVCLVIGYPAASCFARLHGWKATLCSVLILVPLCALPRRIDVVGASPTRQLSLQPEAPGADQEATNGLKHFGKRFLWGSAGHTGRSTSEHRRGLERINVRADPPVERAGRRRQASERDTPLTVSPG